MSSEPLGHSVPWVSGNPRRSVRREARTVTRGHTPHRPPVRYADAGHRRLVKFLAPLAPALAVLEVTGGYERPAVAALAVGGRPVAVVNPARVREFAKALGRLAKTDAIDAAVPAEFADTVRPVARQLTDDATLHLPL